MKILHVAQLLGIGGLEKIIYHLCRQQIKNGHEVAVYIYGYQRDWVDFFRQSGITVITPPLQKNGYDLALLKRLISDTANYDIVHTHDLNPLMYMGPVNLWRKLRMKRTPKLIHTTHGLDHLENYPRSPLYEKRVAPLADRIIGVSQNVCNFYLDQVKLPHYKVIKIDNGVELYDQEISTDICMKKKQWLCDQFDLQLSLPIAITIARVVPLKDQQFLMEEIGKRDDIQLLVVGPSGDDQYYNHLHSFETKAIKLTGGRSDINDLLLGSDLFVSASTHEGIPVAVLEAMGIECPCLVSDIPGHTIINELAPNSVITYKLGDRQNFQQQLTNCLNPQLTTPLKQRGKQAVKDFFSVEAMNRQYEQVYQDALC